MSNKHFYVIQSVLKNDSILETRRLLDRDFTILEGDASVDFHCLYEASDEESVFLKMKGKAPRIALTEQHIREFLKAIQHPNFDEENIDEFLKRLFLKDENPGS